MFIYRIYELDSAGKVSNRQDLSVDVDGPKAAVKARRLAVDCVVELWRGSNLIGTFRPETGLETTTRAHQL
jgi:hypothetical protein